MKDYMKNLKPFREFCNESKNPLYVYGKIKGCTTENDIKKALTDNTGIKFSSYDGGGNFNAIVSPSVLQDLKANGFRKKLNNGMIFIAGKSYSDSLQHGTIARVVLHAESKSIRQLRKLGEIIDDEIVDSNVHHIVMHIIKEFGNESNQDNKCIEFIESNINKIDGVKIIDIEIIDSW
jgi:hypothetical protein